MPRRKAGKAPHTGEEAEKRIRDLAAKGRISFADDDQVAALGGHVQRVLDAIAHYEPGAAEAWVSDESRVSDFLAAEDLQDAITGIAEIIGVPVAAHDYIWKVAERLKLRDGEGS